MMNKFHAVAAAAVLGVAGFAGGAAISQAEAQTAQKAPVILIVDRARLVSQSAAGKTIPTQAESVRNAVAKELEGEAAKLKADVEKYQKSASLMDEEVRAKTEQELAVRQQVILPQQAQIMEQAFTAAVQNAEAKILVEARPILKDIVDKRGATILLDRSAVMYAATETDITQEVLAELDKKLKTVEVEKISLAQIMKMLEEQQAKAKAASADASKGKGKK